MEFGFPQAARATEQAMRAGAEVIYQATFARDGWRGRSDFVMRVDSPSALGDWSYEAWDTKLARSAKPSAVLQLAYYSEEIGLIQGRLPDWLHVVPGTGMHESFRPAEFGAFLRMAQARVRAHVAQPTIVGRLRGRASTARGAPSSPCAGPDGRPRTHLTLVASIRRDQAEKLIDSGSHDARRAGPIRVRLVSADRSEPMLDALRDQAGLQLHRRETGELTRRLLPPETERGLGLLPRAVRG